MVFHVGRGGAGKACPLDDAVRVVANSSTHMVLMLPAEAELILPGAVSSRTNSGALSTSSAIR
jgi:hypothetical protein